MPQTSTFQVYNASAGSGKTFTLVKEYLKILLKSNHPYKFQQILAITFTNKAAAEMKERIVKSLYNFSEKKEDPLFLVIQEELGLEKTEITNKAKQILKAILQNYSAFQIATIDSFTHKIIRTFAYDLGISANFEVEMDVDYLLNKAVETVLSKIGEDEELTQILVDFSCQKIDDNKSWDISLDLKNVAKILLNESDAFQFKKLKKVKTAHFIGLQNKVKKELQKSNKQLKEIGQEALQIIKELGIEYNDFYRSMLPNHFKNLAYDLPKAKFFDQSTLKQRIEEQLFYAKSKPENVKQTIDNSLPKLLLLYEESEKVYQQKIKYDLVVNSLIPLAVLNYINTSLQAIKLENNILLNAEFNAMISKNIKNEPAPFIYERLGEKFRYYFIDEMQDTSVLQWQNLIPLIESAITSENNLGEAGNLMLVGDAKQSIYRWRGGKAEQFINLSLKKDKSNKETNPFSALKKVENLDTNYRSFSEVIQFNNSFFQNSSAYLNNNKYKNLFYEGNQQKTNKNIGGFVQIDFVNLKEQEEKHLIPPQKVLEIVKSLKNNYHLKDICVLVRTREQGINVANCLTDNGIKIESSETLLLKNNDKINFIVNLLNGFLNPEEATIKIKVLYFLYDFYTISTDKHLFLEANLKLSYAQILASLSSFDMSVYRSLPFYESIEYLISSLDLIENSDAYIQFFLDEVLLFQQKKQVSITDFLAHWEQYKDKLSIATPKSNNAVSVMTIHKAKGLEFPVVIFPYDIAIYKQISPKIWIPYPDEKIETVLVNYNKTLQYLDKEEQELYNTRKEELELDNLNLLYVALTRAVEQLYIICEEEKQSKELQKTNQLFKNYLEKQGIWSAEKNTYTFGQKKQEPKEKTEKQNTFKSTYLFNLWKNHNITISTNASLLWNTEKGQAIDYGNLLHKILAEIKYAKDVTKVISKYYYLGFISKEIKKTITTTIKKIVSHPQLKNFYKKEVIVYTEREIISLTKETIIPDRLNFKENKVTIIDYKTGVHYKKYEHQINNYATILEEMGYKVISKMLVYIDKEIKIKNV